MLNLNKPIITDLKEGTVKIEDNEDYNYNSAARKL